MAVVTLAQLKSYFNKGDKPTEAQFVDTIDTLAGGGAYKSYMATLTQIGTAAPTIVSNGTGANTPLENSLGGAIVWTRTGVGAYVGTLTGAFTANKTVLLPSQSQASDSHVTMSIASADAVNLNTFNAAQTVTADNRLNTVPIEIRVYL